MLIATREQVAETPDQLQALLNAHPLHPITQDEGAFANAEYESAMRRAGLEVVRNIGSFESVITTRPGTDELLLGVIAHMHGRLAVLPREVPKAADGWVVPDR